MSNQTKVVDEVLENEAALLDTVDLQSAGIGAAIGASLTVAAIWINKKFNLTGKFAKLFKKKDTDVVVDVAESESVK